MAPMDDSANSSNQVSLKENVSANAEENTNSISNVHNKRIVRDAGYRRITRRRVTRFMYANVLLISNTTFLLFTRLYSLWLIRHSPAFPCFVFCMFSCTAMFIGIMVVCFTVSKLSGMCFLC